jgi:hypothetical protein
MFTKILTNLKNFLQKHKVLFGLCFASILFGGFFLYYFRHILPCREPSIKELLDDPTLTSETYINDKYKFTFQYPQGWILHLGEETDTPDYAEFVVSVLQDREKSLDIHVTKIKSKMSYSAMPLPPAGTLGTSTQFLPKGAVRLTPEEIQGENVRTRFLKENYLFYVVSRGITAEALREIINSFSILPSTEEVTAMSLNPSEGHADPYPPRVPDSPLFPRSILSVCTEPTLVQLLVDPSLQNTYVNKVLHFGFRYPAGWTMERLPFSTTILGLQDYDQKDLLTLTMRPPGERQTKGTIVMNVSPEDPERLPADLLYKSRGIHTQNQFYGKIANVDAIIVQQLSTGFMEISFTKGTYLFNMSLADVEPRALEKILSTFVVDLPEPSRPSALLQLDASDFLQQPSPLPDNNPPFQFFMGMPLVSII